MTRRPEDCRLYAIVDTSYLGKRDAARVASQMIEGGVDLIQLRAKDRTDEEAITLAHAILNVTRRKGIPFIVNDHPHVAAVVGADGAHVGQDDMAVAEARRILGPEGWVGKSTHSLQQALEAEKEGADYIGVGPIFATPTKPDDPPVGLDLVRQVASRVKIPFFCIGGIKLENASEVISAGARRLVVVSGILQSPDLTEHCRRLKALFQSIFPNCPSY